MTLRTYGQIFERFKPYITKPQNAENGDFVILEKDVPADIFEEYKEYISCAFKYTKSWEEFRVTDDGIIYFQKSSDVWKNEQIEIISELMENGIIKRTLLDYLKSQETK